MEAISTARSIFPAAAFPGGGGYREVAFLHKPTRTLVLTDPS